MRRFYRVAGTVATADGHTVALDGKPVRTPGRLPLVLPTPALAEAIAAEWEAQEEEIRPDTMPLTRLANSAIDRVQGQRPAMIERIAAYAASDLLCYRAESPADLVARQEAAWQPLLDWMADRHGARLRVGSGIKPIEQPPEALRAATVAVARFDGFPLAALHVATVSCGSLVIALALADGRVDAAAAWEASLLDELYQAGRWGEEAEATRRRAGIRAEIDTAVAVFSLCEGAR